jgi:glycosyltransferase involved in cell wall biosynthesis
LSKYNRVIFISDGDAKSPELWSGLPCQISQELVNAGIEVVHKNICLPGYCKYIWRLCCGFFIKIFFFRTTYSFSRSATYSFIQNNRIRWLLRNEKIAYRFVFVCTSTITLKGCTVPIILLTDWTYDYYLTKLVGKKPDFFEAAAIKREYKAISASTLLLTIFPRSANRINKKLGYKRAAFLGHGVNLYKMPIDVRGYQVNYDTAKTTLLFVGRLKYRDGLQKLLNHIPASFWADINFEIIGLEKKHIKLNPSIPPEAVKFWGYLSKENSVERSIYYCALQRADVICSLSWPWGPFSAMLEAMYFQTAVITRPYTEFVEIFGDSIDFGWYLTQDSKEEFEMILLEIAKNPEKLSRAQNRAHEIASKMTWKQVACNLLKELESLG